MYNKEKLYWWNLRLVEKQSILLLLGESIDKPDQARGMLKNRPLLLAIVLIIGLYSFSRVLTVALDIHRWALLNEANDEIVNFLFSSIERGSILHSIIIAACGMMIPIGSNLLNGLTLSKLAKKKKSELLLELLVGSVIRLPIVFGLVLIISFFSGVTFMLENDITLIIWVAGVAFALLDSWRVAGKVAHSHGLKPRVGIWFSFLYYFIFTAIFLGILLLIGGIQ
ncbi:MAG: hypothetical protein ACFFCS_03995 [Candidatus Hodarchaeota archaeon]